MKKELTYWGTGAVLLALIVIILYPSAPDLDKYDRLFAQGYYTEVCTGLAEELGRRPDWPEARALYVRAALAQGRVDLAISQMAKLQDNQQLEYQMDSWLRDNGPDPGYAVAAVTAARNCTMANPHWDWSLEFYLRLLVKLERRAEIPEALAMLATGHSPAEQYLPELYSLVAEAWNMMAEAPDFQALWETSVLLEAKFPGQSWRQFAATAIGNAGCLDVVQAENPEDPVLAAYRAAAMLPGDGLRFMRNWEHKFTVPSADAYFYSSFKSRIIEDAESIEPEDLYWVDHDQLIQVAIGSLANPDKCRVIIARLEEEDTDFQELEYIRAALEGPKPRLTLSGTNPVLSPDGRRAVVWRETNWSLYDLSTGSEFPLDAELEHTAWVWAPDSAKIAGAGLNQPGLIAVFDSRGLVLSRIDPGDQRYLPVGWHDAETLWIQPFRMLDWMGQPMLCELESGEIYAHEGMSRSEIQFSPGPKGFFAWQRPGQGPCMQRGDEIHDYSIHGMGIESWAPDGSGLILSRSTGLHLWTGGSEPESLGVLGNFLGWRNQTEFYWAAPVPVAVYVPLTGFVYHYPNESSMYISSLSCRLMTYNINTGAAKEMNVMGHLAAAAGKTAVTVLNGQIYVYDLP